MLAGVQLLKVSAIVAIFFGYFTILSFIIQGLGHARTAMKALIYGILLKMVFQVPMIYMLQATGAMLSTLIGFVFSSCYLLNEIKKNYQVSILDTSADLFKTIVIGISVLISASIVVKLLELVFPLTRFAQIIVLLVAVFFGGIVGILLLIRFNVADELLRRFIPARFFKGVQRK